MGIHMCAYDLKEDHAQRARMQIIAYHYCTQKPYLKVGSVRMPVYSQNTIHMKYPSAFQALICIQIAKGSC